MRQGYRVIDSDTHVNPSLDVLLRYADKELKAHLDELAPYRRQVKPVAGRGDAEDVETSEIVAVLKKSDRTSELLSVVVALADEFGQQLNLAAPSSRPAMESIPVPATIAFSRAVDFEDRGETERAIQEYERTLELHPTHRDAQLALTRLRGGT